MTTPPLEPCVIVIDPVEPPGNLHFHIHPDYLPDLSPVETDQPNLSKYPPQNQLNLQPNPPVDQCIQPNHPSNQPNQPNQPPDPPLQWQTHNN